MKILETFKALPSIRKSWFRSWRVYIRVLAQASYIFVSNMLFTYQWQWCGHQSLKWI